MILVAVSALTWSYADKSKAPRDARKSDPIADLHWGEHVGEVKQLEVNVAFSGQYGETVTDANGTFYHVWGYVFYENKVYQPEYWGVFPLYFFDTTVGATVTVKNTGPRKRAKLRVTTEAYCLRTDDSNGAELAPPCVTDIDLAPGEIAVIDASITPQFVPDAESGLDRLLVKISHPNNGGGPGNSDPALIMVKEAVFCPPEFSEETAQATASAL